MTAGYAMIIGLMICNAKLMIIGTPWGDIRQGISEVYPEFFVTVPIGYEDYLDRINTTDLMNYLFYEAKRGSAVHIKAFITLFPYFVDEVYVDDKDLNSFIGYSYGMCPFEALEEAADLFFTEDDINFYFNRILPMSARYK